MACPQPLRRSRGLPAATGRLPPAGTLFAAPVQAITWALIIEFIASLLARHWQQVWRVGALSVLVASAVAATYRYQQAQTNTSFEKIVCIFNQVHYLAPIIVPDTLVLLV